MHKRDAFGERTMPRHCLRLFRIGRNDGWNRNVRREEQRDKGGAKTVGQTGLGFSKCVFTADAMSCQKNIVDKIREKGGHFLIEVKGNQKTLKWNLEDNLLNATCTDVYTSGVTLGHGRIESRVSRVYNGDDVIADKEKWGSLLKVLEINTKTVTKKTGKETVERRFYITDLDFGAKRLSDISRSHWAIESMHWVLDRDFKQDCVKGKTKKRQGTLTQYSVAIHHIGVEDEKRNLTSRQALSELLRVAPPSAI